MKSVSKLNEVEGKKLSENTNVKKIIEDLYKTL